MRKGQQQASFYARDAVTSDSSASRRLLPTSHPKTGFGLTWDSELDLGIDDKECSSCRCKACRRVAAVQQEGDRTS
ncbi:hypothetical protein MKY92_26615 [Paenibacillus sp. FSL R5-0623]|uniref:hypothetical protein n=1 Tax=Paenibacillus sp. FSL R5-0623 TaxID=2921651 RepID=UPI0030DDB668